MDNRFLEMDQLLTGRAEQGRYGPNDGRGNVAVMDRRPASFQSSWVAPFSAADRVLVILIENGGVDLGIPELVDKLLAAIPQGNLIPDSYRKKLVTYLRDKIRGFTDNLLETLELSVNRYTAAKPEFFSNVIVLRDGTASYEDLKSRLITLARAGKIVDLVILTHGSGDFISVTGGINSQKIRAMKAENGGPLTLRSVYMMNCVGSSLNQPWLDAGAKTSSGSIGNNYLPEPTMFFFWKNWKAGQTFQEAATGAYKQTIDVMNGAIRGFVSALPIPGAGTIASLIDVATFDFVKESAPWIQGQSTVTISADSLTLAQSVSDGLGTTVLPVSVARSLAASEAAPAGANRPARSASAAGIDLLKGWESFHPKTYNDAAGQCAVGYGTVLHAGACDGRPVEQPWADGISDEKATELVRQRAAESAQVVTDTVSVPLTQNQVDALVSFVSNVGDASFQESTLLRLLNDGKASDVPAEIKKWTKARQNGQVVDLPELARRREAEAALFQKPAPADPAASQSMSGNFARGLSGIDYTIPGVLPVIRQPSPRTCWAAVITMMYSWKNNVSIAIRDVLTKVGPRYVEMFDTNALLDATGAGLLYDDVGLVRITSFNPTIEGWASMLRMYGPLYVDVGYGTSAVTHAIVVTGISGDGTPAGTSLTYVDPDPGTTITRPFMEFLKAYEAPGAVNNWPHVIVHWPPQASAQQSLPVRHSSCFESLSLVTQMSGYSYAQNPGVIIAGMTVGDAAQVGLAAVSIVQSQVSASQGSFSLSFDKATRMLTNEARQKMPGAQSTKKSYSRLLLHLGIGRINTAKANIIVEWEGNPYGEIGTPIIRRDLANSTEWSKSSANITITKVDRIPLPNTDPRTWPIVYTYEGTFDPLGNGYFEFNGEFEVNAFGGLKFIKHQVFSRSFSDWALSGTPEGKVQRGADNIVPVPTIPQEQINFLREHLP